MNKKKVLALMAMLTVTAMVTACGGKKEEAAVTETQAVESTVVESIATENTEQVIEEDTDVALAESVEETEEEKSSVEYNAYIIGGFINYKDQALEVAEALDELGFGTFEDLSDQERNYRTITDENGMSVIIYDDQDNYITDIVAEDGETVLWEWEYTDKYEKAEDERMEKLREERNKDTE